MNANEPIIRPLPTPERFKQLVDELITPEYADREVKAFIDIVLTVANSEDDTQWHLANEAARHAFSKTDAAEKAFRDFAGFPDRPGYVSDRYVIEARTEI